MTWRLTDSLDAFLAATDDHLRADPVQHTVALTVLATLRQEGPNAFGDSPPAFGWHESATGETDGAFFQTPPFPVMITSLPPGSVDWLLDYLASRPAPFPFNIPSADEAGVLAAWAALTGGTGSSRMRTRLHKLWVLTPPDPLPPGTARIADDRDRDLLVDWCTAFARETGAGALGHADREVDGRLSHHGFTLWETGGAPVSLAGLQREVAGVARITDVYTPPVQRRRGYGAAVTAAVSQAAIAAGAREVVLYTDLANPTSNALYQRLGYRPVADRVLLDLTTSESAPSDVTGEPGVPSETS